MRNKEYTGSYNAYYEFQALLEKIYHIIGNINRKYIMPERMAYIDSLFDAKNPDNIRDMEENAGIFIALCYKDGNKLLPSLLKAADKHGVDWCQKVVSLAEDNTIMNANRQLFKEFQQGPRMPISGVYLDIDLAEIKRLYEYSINQHDITGYREHQQIRDNYREALFNMIADGKTLYSYEELKEFHDASENRKETLIICASDDWRDKTNVFETDGYKRAMRRIEYEILKHENKEIFESRDFTKLSEKEKKLVLEFADSKDEVVAIVDTYKGNITYDDALSKRFTKDEFEQIVEDYKITQYRRESERLTEENKQIKEQVAKERKAVEEEKAELTQERESIKREKIDLAQEKINMERTVEAEMSKARNIVKGNALQNDIRAVCQGEKNVDEFEPARLKEIFNEMKKEVLQNPNLRENHLVGMCKIYTSKTNTPEQKAEYFKGLHEVRKSGTTNAEKREMAQTFERVLGRNPDLSKDEALRGLAKIDYSAVGIKPTERGFKYDSSERK